MSRQRVVWALRRLEEAVQSGVLHVDEHGNEWSYERGHVLYEFEPDELPRRRKWPPRRDHLKTAEKVVYHVWGGPYVTRLSDIEVSAAPGRAVRLQAVMPAFQPWMSRGKHAFRSFLSTAQVWFDLSGRVVEVRPEGAVPLPDVVKRYAGLIQRHRKTFRRDVRKGHHRAWYYIRFGDWTGASKFGLSTGTSYETPDEWAELGKKFESGVSVYGASRERNLRGWVLHDVDRQSAIYHVGGDYWDHMLGNALKDRPIYLLRGKPVMSPDDRGREHLVRGSDGEPLLVPDTVQKIRQLRPQEVFLSHGGESIGKQWGWRNQETA